METPCPEEQLPPSADPELTEIDPRPADDEEEFEIDSLPSSRLSSSPTLTSSDVSHRQTDAEREWRESIQQLELILSLMIVPFLGKYFGRKAAYWGELFSGWNPAKSSTNEGSKEVQDVLTLCLGVTLRLGEIHDVEVPRRRGCHFVENVQGDGHHRGSFKSLSQPPTEPELLKKPNPLPPPSSRSTICSQLVRVPRTMVFGLVPPHSSHPPRHPRLRTTFIYGSRPLLTGGFQTTSINTTTIPRQHM